jgi:hypothetical protein
MRKQIIFLLVCVGVLVVLTAGFYSAAKSNHPGQPTTTVVQASAGNVVFSIPIGGEGIRYANTDAEESEPWGPSALRLGPDGSFVVVDSVGNRILRFDRQGNRLQTIPVSEAVGITDVVLDEHNIFVLDESAMTPTVFRMSRTGEVVGRETLSPAVRKEGLSGITKGETGEVLMELQGGVATRKLTGGESFDGALRGNRFSVNVSNRPQAQYLSRARISLPGGVATIDVDNLLGGVDIISVDNSGNVYVLIEEVTSTPEINVDQTIRRLRPDGTVTGVARVPMNSFTAVRHNVAVSPEGYVYALVTKRDRVDVVRLEFSTQLPRVLSTAPSRLAAFDSPNAAQCTRTREDMVATAETYLNNSVDLSLNNLNGQCGGRTKPRYLGATAGQYKSVAYDWGGWETVTKYNEHMAQGKVAGDINSEAVESCSHGVDCSGFVTVCWGITDQKYGTRTLPEISNLIDGADLRRGDILNFAGKHVVMFDKFARSSEGVRGVMAWESTTTDGADRVVYRWSSWRRLAGYVARRYKKVCD